MSSSPVCVLCVGQTLMTSCLFVPKSDVNYQSHIIAEAIELLQNVVNNVRYRTGKIIIFEDLQSDDMLSVSCGIDAQWDSGLFSALYNSVRQNIDEYRNGERCRDER